MKKVVMTNAWVQYKQGNGMISFRRILKEEWAYAKQQKALGLNYTDQPHVTIIGKVENVKRGIYYSIKKGIKHYFVHTMEGHGIHYHCPTYERSIEELRDACNGLNIKAQKEYEKEQEVLKMRSLILKYSK